MLTRPACRTSSRCREGVLRSGKHHSRSGIFAAAFALLATAACASACGAEPTVQASLEIARPFGDVYNERTTDGDAYPTSLGLRGSVGYKSYAQYVTEMPPTALMRPSFGIVKIEAGLQLRRPRSALYAVIGYANESRSGHALPSDVRFIRSDPYAAIGIRL